MTGPDGARIAYVNSVDHGLQGRDASLASRRVDGSFTPHFAFAERQ